MIFNKNVLINETLDKHFETWMHTLNTTDFVQKRYLKYIDKVIFENLKKKLKEVDIYNLLYLELQGFKLGFWDRLKIYCSGLRPLFENELNALENEQEEAAEQQQGPSDNSEQTSELESEQVSELEQNNI